MEDRGGRREGIACGVGTQGGAGVNAGGGGGGAWRALGGGGGGVREGRRAPPRSPTRRTRRAWRPACPRADAAAQIVAHRRGTTAAAVEAASSALRPQRLLLEVGQSVGASANFELDFDLRTACASCEGAARAQ